MATQKKKTRSEFNQDEIDELIEVYDIINKAKDNNKRADEKLSELIEICTETSCKG